MKCLHCNVKNSKKAPYCIACGAPFSTAAKNQKRPQPNVTPKVYKQVPLFHKIKSCVSVSLGIGLLFLPGIIQVWYRTGSLLNGFKIAGMIISIMIALFTFLMIIEKLLDV